MSSTFHSVKLIEDRCTGCIKCMLHCPVEAIRLKDSRAVIYNDKCIDCGKCIKACAYKAHVVEREDLDIINNFKVKVAIPSVTIYGQFGKYIDPCIINEGIKELGFDDVFDITAACEIIAKTIKEEIKKIKKPAISSLCPSVVRLIQSNYPELLDHVVRVLAPIEVAAGLARKKYRVMGYSDEDIGIFFISPCPSWLTQIRHWEEDSNYMINGGFAFSDIYPKLLKNIGNIRIENPNSNFSYSGLSWAAVGGQSNLIGVKDIIIVDGVENVVKVLDDIEKDRLDDVEFIEAFTCTNGCLGGLLLVENPYNAERIIKKYEEKLKYEHDSWEEDTDNVEFLSKKNLDNNSNQKLADDFESAVKKMKYMNEILSKLPGKDCGFCGSPSCRAFAEDVVRGLASLEDCKINKIGG